MNREEVVENTPPSAEAAAENDNNTPSPPPPSPKPEYDPERVCTPEQLEALNLLVHPIWIFDFCERRMRWANTAGLAMWNAETLRELQERNFQDISAASAKRMEEMIIKCDLGQHMTEQWTLYPKGKACTVHMNVSGLRLSVDDDHPSLMCEGIPLVKDELVKENLRGMEMLRHLPMAVCQFDMEGKVIFQNPAATLWKESTAVPPNNNNNSNSSTAPAGENGGASASLDDISQYTANTTDTQTTNNDDHDCDNRSTTSSSDGSVTTNSTRKQQAGNLLNRFIDVELGKQLLEKIQTTKKCDVEAMLHTQAGPRWSAIQLVKANDPVTGESVILYSARDKSDAVRANKERKARERKSEFLAIMAHEIRTPLHQVTGFIDLLDQTQLNTEQKSFVKLLKSSAQGLMTVISDVLDYSKLEAGKMKLERIPYEPLSVVEGSMEAVRQSCEEKNLTLTLEEWNKDIPFKVMGDPNRLRQILLNLLSNAVKFTQQGGISVQAMLVQQHSNNNNNKLPKRSNSKRKAVLNGTKHQNNGATTSTTTCPMVKFVVKDTGVGIAPEHVDSIFRKYQQADVSVARNFGGTGLGLSICQLLTQNMQGSIGVESEVGRGASFWFMLPAEECDNTMDDADENCILQDGSVLQELEGLQVLVVEDNKVNQKLMSNMLRRLGHQVCLAENGKEAIDMIVQRSQKGQQQQQLGENGTTTTIPPLNNATEMMTTPFDLVLMDIQMPIMDGLEATRRLRTMGYTTLPIFGLTASVARSDFTELGFNDWLPKPTPLKDLKAKLYRLRQQSTSCQQQSNNVRQQEKQ